MNGAFVRRRRRIDFSNSVLSLLTTLGLVRAEHTTNPIELRSAVLLAGVCLKFGMQPTDPRWSYDKANRPFSPAARYQVVEDFLVENLSPDLVAPATVEARRAAEQR